MNAKFVLIAFVFAFMSCNKNEVYNDFNRDFSENRWETKDDKEFEFEIKQSEALCNVKLHFGHISGFQFNEVPLEVEITLPNGSVETIPVVLKLKDDSGIDIGDCSGDVCDVFQTIKTYENLEKGFYKIKVKSLFSGDYLPNVLGLGIFIEKYI